MDESLIQPITFFLAIFHSEEENVWQELKEHITGEYLIAKETAKTSHIETKGQHIHYLVNMELREYNNFIKRIKLKYKHLRGKTPKNTNLPRTYGRCKEIENIELLKSYLVKDCDDINQTTKFLSLRTNYTTDSLNAYYALSYQKRGNRQRWQKILAYALELLQIKKDKHNKQMGFNKLSYTNTWAFEKEPYCIQILSETNKEYRRLNDGNSLTQASTLKILFHLEYITDETYMENMYERITHRQHFSLPHQNCLWQETSEI